MRTTCPALLSFRIGLELNSPKLIITEILTKFHIFRRTFQIENSALNSKMSGKIITDNMNKIIS